MQMTIELTAPASSSQPHTVTSFHMVTRPSMQTELMMHKKKATDSLKLTINIQITEPLNIPVYFERY